MDTWYLLIVGAIGWTGFIGCALAMKTKRTIAIVVAHPEMNAPKSSEWSDFHSDPAVSAYAIAKPKAEIENILPQGLPYPSNSEPQTIIEPEIPEEMHRIAQIVEPLIDQYDTVRQSGDWKRHQVYAAVLKNQKVLDIIGDDKWKAGFAIELAVAQRRMNAEEVGA